MEIGIEDNAGDDADDDVEDKNTAHSAFGFEPTSSVSRSTRSTRDRDTRPGPSRAECSCVPIGPMSFTSKLLLQERAQSM